MAEEEQFDSNRMLKFDLSDIQAKIDNEIEVDFVGLKIRVNKDTYAKYVEWVEKVALPLEELGAIGGEFSYTITPTSIGTIYKVFHSNGEKFDLTNYDLW